MDRKFITVVDLEATCWNSSESQAGQTSEIIEIGMVLLNTETGEVVNPISMKVKPQHSTVSQFCTDLTGLTQKDVEKAPNLHKACEYLRKQYNSHRYVWASFGEWDRYMMDKSVETTRVKSPFSGVHTNVQAVFGWTLPLTQKNDLSLQKAVEVAGLNWVGRAHSGVDDAHNAANLLSCLSRKTPSFREGMQSAS